MRSSQVTMCAVLAAAFAAPAAAQPEELPPPLERVYVPIEDFDEIFEGTGGGVFVPYEDLRRLIEELRQRAPEPEPEPEPEPPTDYVLVAARLSGSVGEQVARFEATFEVEILEGEEWVVVPLGLGQASLESVTTAAGDPVVVGPLSALLRGARGEEAEALRRQGGYGMLLRGAGRVTTTARFALPVASQTGESSVRVTLPETALNQFEVQLPQAGVRVQVEGALASESSDLADVDRTAVRAYFGAGAEATVRWTPRPREVQVEQRDPLLQAELEGTLQIHEGRLQVTGRVIYAISQAPCDRFELRFPKQYRLMAVLGEHLSADPIAREDGAWKTVAVRLIEPVSDRYELTVQLDRDLPAGDQTVVYPRLETVGTERESGRLAVRASRFLTVEPVTQRGVTQVDTDTLSQAHKRDLSWQADQPHPPLVFRYLRQNYQLEVQSAVIQPVVKGQVHTLATVRDDEIGMASTVTYTIEKRGVFGVRIGLPEGFEVIQCGDGNTIRAEDPVEPTESERALGIAQVLRVDFAGQAKMGAATVTILGKIRREGTQGGDDPETDALELPRLRLLDVEEERGVLVVGSQRHLKLSLNERGGLIPVAISDLVGMNFALDVDRQDEEKTFGFRYSNPDRVEAEFSVKKREPKVTAQVEQLVDAQEDQVRVEATVRYSVEFAGVEQVRLRVPEALGNDEDFKIEGDGIQDRRVEPDPRAPNKAIWTVALQGKRIGEFTVRLRYDIKLDDFAAGQQTLVTLHEVEVLDCFSETGDVALKKHENLVIRDHEVDMLERRDKRELPQSLQRQGAIQAYRYVSHPHRLTLQITKYDFQAPLGILIEHLHHDELVTQDGAVQAEAWLRVQNNSQQSLTVLLPEGAACMGLQVDGQTKMKSEGPQIEGRPTVQVHLGDVARDAPFVVRIRYRIDANVGALGVWGDLRLDTLRFPLKDGEEVPVARLTRQVYLPEGMAYLEFETDSTKHFEETSLWEQIKGGLGVRSGRERAGVAQGARDARATIQQLKSRDRVGGAGVYPYLAVPRGVETPYLFEKLDNPSFLRVQYAAWSLFFFLDVLVLVGVVAVGFGAERTGKVGVGGYVGVVSALALLGATFAGKAMEPFYTSGLVGAVGLGFFAMSRGLWRELTVVRHARQLEALERQAQVARARAQAAEAESHRSTSTNGDDPAERDKQTGPSAADRAAAEKITLEEAEAPTPADSGSADPGEGPEGSSTAASDETPGA